MGRIQQECWQNTTRIRKEYREKYGENTTGVQAEYRLNTDRIVAKYEENISKNKVEYI